MNESIKQPIINDGHYFQSQNMVAPQQSTNIWIFSANVMDNTVLHYNNNYQTYTIPDKKLFGIGFIE